MPVIDTKNTSLHSLSGIHLWHAKMSSCSQRVRIVLAENNLDFTSNLIDLAMGEQASPEYQSIHPNGVVPAMVIDGELIIESTDIIDELDKRFGGGSLRPKAPDDIVQMREIMERANSGHAALKLLTFEFLFSAAPPPPKKAYDKIQATHKNEYLKNFHRDVAIGFSRERVSEQVANAHEDMLYLETTLSHGHPYLLGKQFTLADITWIPNFHRLDLINWPYENYPKLKAWFERVSARPGYKTGLVDWEPDGFEAMISPKINARQKAGDGVDNYIPKPSAA